MVGVSGIFILDGGIEDGRWIEEEDLLLLWSEEGGGRWMSDRALEGVCVAGWLVDFEEISPPFQPRLLLLSSLPHIGRSKPRGVIKACEGGGDSLEKPLSLMRWTRYISTFSRQVFVLPTHTSCLER